MRLQTPGIASPAFGNAMQSQTVRLFSVNKLRDGVFESSACF
jgi:hypothetical protein